MSNLSIHFLKLKILENTPIYHLHLETFFQPDVQCNHSVSCGCESLRLPWISWMLASIGYFLVCCCLILYLSLISLMHSIDKLAQLVQPQKGHAILIYWVVNMTITKYFISSGVKNDMYGTHHRKNWLVTLPQRMEWHLLLISSQHCLQICRCQPLPLHSRN